MFKTAKPYLAVGSRGRWVGSGILAVTLISAILLAGRMKTQAQIDVTDESARRTLSLMSLEAEKDEHFERKTLEQFGAEHGLTMRFAQWPQATSTSRLAIYQELFRSHSPNPDLVEIDVVWPQVLADDLIDLRPYFGKELKAFAPELLQNFTIRGRLVAIPTMVDMGVLYSRSDLLTKYGFAEPPKTWQELERMARVIQAGERRSGNPDFWGYVWQGHTHEGLTCNALEWQASEGAGTILEADGRVNVANPKMVRALDRALSWIGTISPPGENSYWENDSLNLWQAGNVAFMRNWASWYGAVGDASESRRYPMELSVLPAGESGHKGTLGGVAIGVSRYSRNQAQAMAAVRWLTAEATQVQRATEVGTIPTRLSLRKREEVMAHTALSGRAAQSVMTSLVARPSKMSGKRYDVVSQAYIKAVHSVLTRQQSAEAAMAGLRTELTRITAQPN